MLEYIYLAVAVILVVGIAIVGVVMYRRDGEAGLEGMTHAEATDVAGSEDFDALGAAAADDMAAVENDPAIEQPPAVPMVATAAFAAGGAAAAVAAPAAPAAATAGAAAAGPATAGAAFGAASSMATSYAATGNGSANSALLADPLGTVILNLVDGRGKLSGQDLKRLDVFRPERVGLAAETVELPPQLANDEEALLRLAQIKLYGATLELRAKWSAQMLRGSDSLSDRPLSAREFKLKIARDIMALPAPDRSEVVGYLLGGILSGNGHNPKLKRAVIDTLEHLQSAALVNVLLDCLDDPDPIIQEYALAAADRLLDGK
jgi:hypothetical protein